MVLPFWVPRELRAATGRPKVVDVDASSNPDFRAGMDLYQNGNYQGALDLFHRAAEEGVVQAFIQIGLMYDFGRGVRQDYLQARQWYSRAADKGDLRAIYLMGHMFEFGEGVAINLDMAYSWYLKAAQSGDASGRFEVGRMLVGLGPDSARYREGVEWLRLAARQCHAGATTLLQTVAIDDLPQPGCCTVGGG